MGIEPTRSAWKADVLPLNYARDPGVGSEMAPGVRRAGGARCEAGAGWWGEQDSNL